MMCRASFTIALVLTLCSAGLTQQKPPPAAQPSIPGSALALMPKPTLGDVLHVQSRIASFKIVPKGPELPAGRLEFSFKNSSVLINGLETGAYLHTTGNIRQEYENKDHKRQVYFGTGSVLIVGRFKTCQWFGRDLDFTFKGRGVVRMIAEFDDKRETGSFWYGDGPKSPLQTALVPLILPEVHYTAIKAIKREDFEKQKKRNGGG